MHWKDTLEQFRHGRLLFRLWGLMSLSTPLFPSRPLLLQEDTNKSSDIAAI